eukprot:m.243494 g.243494  ORF g.243494 m.243494 type:complete len:209 (+) comp33811_c0_seq10:148-774(+)
MRSKKSEKVTSSTSTSSVSLKPVCSKDTMADKGPVPNNTGKNKLSPQTNSRVKSSETIDADGKTQGSIAQASKTPKDPRSSRRDPRKKPKPNPTEATTTTSRPTPSIISDSNDEEASRNKNKATPPPATREIVTEEEYFPDYPHRPRDTTGEPLPDNRQKKRPISSPCWDVLRLLRPKHRYGEDTHICIHPMAGGGICGKTRVLPQKK